MTEQNKALRIDIVSDVVCPWCIVGYRQLQAAIDNTGIKTDIHWHPFELNPDMPAEGQNMQEHIAEKYGSSAEESKSNRERLTEVGAELGFKFDFSEDMRMVNTFDAHQLIHWAETQQRANDLKQALFIAHFSDHKTISDHQTLAEIAQSVGLDRAEALQVLADQRYASDVRERQGHWIKQGIQGVPAVVFDSKYLVSGAQGTEQFERCLTDVVAQQKQA